MRTNRWGLYIGVGVVMCIVFIAPLLGSHSGGIIGFIRSVTASSHGDEYESLKKLYEDLKNKYVLLEQAQTGGELASPSLDRVNVFSSYPFNTKNRIYIDRGVHDGIKNGQFVLFSERVLLGFVTQVRGDVSEVMTIFDPSFSIPVRIGASHVDGLLQGGVTPTITLIDKAKHIESGDVVISATKDALYGLTLGSISDVSEDSLGAFFEAKISIPYSINDVHNVYIQTHL